MIILDSTPLIYLTRIGKIEKIAQRFGQIILSRPVYSETVLSVRDRSEVVKIRSLIKAGVIKVEKRRHIRVKVRGLHDGEIETLYLAKEKKAMVVVDDKPAFQYAKLLGLKVIRTLAVMLELLRKKVITVREFRDNLSMLSSEGFWLTSEIYERALKEVQRYM